MEGKEVKIEEILLAREKRAEIQKQLIKKYNSAIISFTMNIPGAIKTNILIRKVFDYGKEILLKKLEENKIEIIEVQEFHKNTGDEIIIVAKAEAQKLKEIAINVEEEEEIGRIFDIDIIDKNFEKLSRKKFRKCFVCNEQAQICARSGRHSIKELQNKVLEILKLLKD